MDQSVLDRLVDAACAASANAYAPYSGFPVGAALLDGDGRMFRGANIENASYGLGCCAERSAVFAMASAGGRKILAIAVYTPTEAPTRPCGACRQVLLEFGRECAVVCACAGPVRFVSTLAELFPEPFTL
jgi:cytidine deaminase